LPGKRIKEARAIEMFIQLHGNLPILEIKRSHARRFREALQLVDGDTRVPLMWFTRDTKVGRRLKTKSSERVVPVHPQLIEIGFLNYVAERRKEDEQAWLFPTVAPNQKGALRAWAKWWGATCATM
jgi:hypothetical protein